MNRRGRGRFLVCTFTGYNSLDFGIWSHMIRITVAQYCPQLFRRIRKSTAHRCVSQMVIVTSINSFMFDLVLLLTCSLTVSIQSLATLSYCNWDYLNWHRDISGHYFLRKKCLMILLLTFLKIRNRYSVIHSIPKYGKYLGSLKEGRESVFNLGLENLQPQQGL